MSVAPLNDRVLVRPVVAPVSDIIAAPDDHYEPEQMGTVVAMGSAVSSRKRAIDMFAAQIIDQVQNKAVAQVVRRLADDYRPEPACAVGDMVCFSPKHGQELIIDGASYIILREDDVLAVVEPEAVA